MDFMSSVGRIVQGSALEPQTKGKNGQPLTYKKGPQAGQPRIQFFLAVAFAKTQAAFWLEPDQFLQNIYRTAMQGYPQHFNPDGSCKKRDFAFKVMDGDGLDDDGNPNNQKEGFAGHWVVKFSNGFAPKVWMNGAYTVDVNAVKRGSFVRVMGNMEPNIGSESPGVYLNHSGIEFIGYGPEIVSGPNVGAAFQAAGRPVALPAGVSLTPPTPAISNMPAPSAMPGAPMQPAGMPQMPAMAPAQPAGMPQMPGVAAGPAAMPGAPMQPAGMPQMPAMPAGMPAPGGIQPNHGFVQNVIGQPPGAMVAPAGMPAMPQAIPQPAAVAQPVYQMTAAAGGFTREQYLQQPGWSDAVLLERGMMVRTA